MCSEKQRQSFKSHIISIPTYIFIGLFCRHGNHNKNSEEKTFTRGFPSGFILYKDIIFDSWDSSSLPFFTPSLSFCLLVLLFFLHFILFQQQDLSFNLVSFKTYQKIILFVVCNLSTWLFQRQTFLWCISWTRTSPRSLTLTNSIWEGSMCVLSSRIPRLEIPDSRLVQRR